MPGPMAAHGMSGQVRALRIGLEPSAGLLQHFQRIPPPPIFPIETEAAPIGGRDHVRLGLAAYTAAWPVCFDTRTMQ